MGPEFFQTRMGQKFFEHDVPRIGDALERIATALEEICEENAKGGADEKDGEGKESPP